MITVSERLRTIAEKVPPGSAVADIGTDHALLPVFLALGGRIRRAVAGDVRDGPIEAARQQVARAGLEQIVEIRKGDGLRVLEPGEADCVVIAGMGGPLIRRILEEGKERLAGARRLILQPNTGGEQVRGWLKDNGWRLVGEEMLEEGGQIYEILIGEPAGRGSADGDPLYRDYRLPCGAKVDEDLLLRMGPHLLRKADGVFLKKWRAEKEKLDEICLRVRLSRTEEARRRLGQLEDLRNRIGEVLRCIQKGKPSSG